MTWLANCAKVFEQDPAQLRVAIPYPDWGQFWRVCCSEHGYDDTKMLNWQRYDRLGRLIKRRQKRKRERKNSETDTEASSGRELEEELDYAVMQEDPPEKPPYSYGYFLNVRTTSAAAACCLSLLRAVCC